MKDNKTIDLLKNLISIKSYVGDGVNEEKVGKYIQQFFKENTDLKVDLQEVEDGRFNLIAYKNKEPKIVFFGHMDTVPPKVDSKNPFEPREDDGKIYGLGSVDMKAGVAIMLDISRKYSKRDDIAYVITVDEEYDFKGAFKLIKEYSFDPEYIVNVEPTDLKILNGCRGVTEFSFNSHGKSCHAGRKDLGVNAIEKTAELYKKLQDEISKLDTDELKNTLNLAYLNGGILNKEDEVTSRANVVPNFTKSVGEIRIANLKITKDYLKDKIEELALELDLTISEFKVRFLLGSMFTEQSKLKEFEDAIKKSGLEVEYGDISITGYYEVQLLQGNWGGNVVVFGPSPSSMAHCVDEYVDIKSVKQTQDVLERFTDLIIKD